MYDVRSRTARPSTYAALSSKRRALEHERNRTDVRDIELVLPLRAKGLRPRRGTALRADHDCLAHGLYL